MNCDCDRIIVNEVIDSRQLCSESEVIPFISLENKISLTMVSDELYTSKGFVAAYQSVFLDGG